MATPPSEVRTGLQLVTAASVREVQQVVAAQDGPQATRSALLVAVPLIVGEYIDGSSALALDWYEELREEAAPPSPFSPNPFTVVRDEYLGNAVAWATQPLVDVGEQLARLTEEFDREVQQATDLMLARLEPVVQKEVAAGFWDTVTQNVREDPAAVGWARFTRPGACSLCRMLADKGAIYTETTVRFAAHTGDHCVTRPAFSADEGPEASVMQYMASKKRRTAAEKARLREYLKKHYGA
ncbi:MAG: hypothetical protein JWP74_1755 [Marmoricola sp.]|nr:hypothetical protein [Marmoricola sp.]